MMKQTKSQQPQAKPVRPLDRAELGRVKGGQEEGSWDNKLVVDNPGQTPM